MPSSWRRSRRQSGCWLGTRAARGETRWSQQSRLLIEVLLARLAQPAPAVAASATPAAPGPAAESPAPQREPRGSPAPSRPLAPRPAGAPEAARPPAQSKIPPAPWELDPPLSVGDSRAGVEAEASVDLDALFPKRGQARAPGPPASDGNTPVKAEEAEAPSGPLGEITRQWRLIREELKRRKKRSVEALLGDARPRALEGETLVLELPGRPLADLVTRHADTIAAVIGDICHVRC